MDGSAFEKQYDPDGALDGAPMEEPNGGDMRNEQTNIYGTFDGATMAINRDDDSEQWIEARENK